jgi:malonate transporter
MNRRIGWNDAAFRRAGGGVPQHRFHGGATAGGLARARSAAGPAILSMAIDMLVITSLCIALSRLGGADQHGAAKALRSALKGVLSNPMPWAILLGALASVLAFELPAPLAKVVGMLADAASPVALFTIGAVLARSQMLAASGHAAAPLLRDYLPVALVKLFLHPLLLLLVGAALIQLGLPLERFALTVLVLVAALPSASNVSLLAERFGADNGRVARIILLSTAAAFVTFSLAVALLLP